MLKNLKRSIKSDDTETFGTVSKRPRRAAAIPAMPVVDQVKICQDLYEILRTHKTSEGRLLCQAFIRAPSKRNLPQYHEVIQSPTDLLKIHQKLKNDEYQSVDQLTADVQLMIENAKTYFARSSQEYRDASTIWELYNESMQHMVQNFSGSYGPTEVEAFASAVNLNRGENSSPALSSRSLRSNSPATRSNRSKDASPSRLSLSGSDQIDKSFLEELLSSVIQLTDESGRSISDPFKILPSKTMYPEYYSFIKEPIDLRTIALRLTGDHYKSLNDLDRDLTLMLKNAKTFNEPQSLIYKDAMFIRKFIALKKQEVLDSVMLPIPKERLKKNSRIIAEVSKLESAELLGSEALVEDDDNDADVDPKNQFWILYLCIRYYQDPKMQQQIAEPFCKLPSRKLYPDYYDEIKCPISLFVIKYRIRNNKYRKLHDLLKDMLQMFDNAQTYNIEGSPIYESAALLQKVVQQTYDKLIKGVDVQLPDRTVALRFTDDDSGSEEESDEDSEAAAPSTTAMTSSAQPVRKPRKPKRPKMIGPDGKPVRGRPSRKSIEEMMTAYRTKLMSLYNCLIEFKDDAGSVYLIGPFMEKPSAKDYPDYYEVIPEPMDMKTIKENISNDVYASSKELAADVKLMFSNAKHYNEESSQIYKDACTLERCFRNAHAKMGLLYSPRALKEKFSGAQRSSMCSPGSNSGTQTPQSASKMLRRVGSVIYTPLSDQQLQKMQRLFDAIKDYTDHKGRLLSTIFVKLPSRQDYPDYYDVIRKPIDLTRIGAKLQAGMYESLDALVQDLNQMFDNACRYNDPESFIYKDALTLQRVLLEKKTELRGEEEHGCDTNVPAIVQELLTTLFISVYNHHDEQDRCYSDSLAELPDLVKQCEPTKRLPSLDGIKRNLDKGRYKRLDKFQEDVFEIFDSALRLSRTDSELFEDVVELQSFFIKKRDELCGNGERFSSPALVYNLKHFTTVVEHLRQNKQPGEIKEDAATPQDPACTPAKIKEGDKELDSVTFNEIVYRVGDYAKVKPNDGKMEPHLLSITRIWYDSELNETFVTGRWFHRPHETYHLAKRKFLQQEVFDSDFFDTVQIDRLLGRCYVMFVRDYFTKQPVGFDDTDVFVCESKYLGRIRHFKKLKQWRGDADESVHFIQRKTPIRPLRVPSVFVSAPEKNDSALHQASVDDGGSAADSEDSNDDGYEILDRQREEVELEVTEPLPGAKYYEQLQYNGLWFKLGDCVYVELPIKEQPTIVCISRIWRTVTDGQAFLCGTVFLRPVDVVHEPCRMFYRREVFLSHMKETIPLSQVIGKCCVLVMKDFCTFRPTEYFEKDVYVCERKEAHRSTEGEVGQLKRNSSEEGEDENIHEPENAGNTSGSTTPLSDGSLVKFRTLKQYRLSGRVLHDEYYYFKKPIQPEKELSPNLIKNYGTSPSNLGSGGETGSVKASANEDNHKEIDIDDLLSGIDFNEYNSSEVEQVDSPAQKRKSGGRKSTSTFHVRSKSGYILFSAEVRKRVMAEYPNAPFGEISRMVGQEWKNLLDEERAEYDERANKLAELDKLKKAAMAASGQATPSSPAVPSNKIRVWPCQWKDCELEFETQDQLIDHLTSTVVVHGHCTQLMKTGSSDYGCRWTSCSKFKKDAKPFPSLSRLAKHLKVKHGENLNVSRMILPSQKSKHFVPVPQAQPPVPVPQPTVQGQQVDSQPPHVPVAAQPPSSVGPQHLVVYQQEGSSQATVAQSQQQQQHLVALGIGQTPGNAQNLIVYQFPQGHPGLQAQQAGAIMVSQAGGLQTMQAAAVSVAGVQSAAHSASASQFTPPPYSNADPGKVIVQAPPRPMEPVFVAPPSQHVQRVLHSETYLRYIESLNTNQTTVSKWERVLNAKRENTSLPPDRQLKPFDWFATPLQNKEDAQKAMWALRDHMLYDILKLDSL